MKKLRNVLYVLTDGTRITRDGRTLLVENEDSGKRRFPVHALGEIVCFGRTWISPEAMGLCAENGVCIAFLDFSGRFLARVEGPVRGNVLLRRAQHEVTRGETRALPVARALVAAKIANQRNLLRRHVRDHAATSERSAALDPAEAAERLSRLAQRALHAPDMDGLRGLEGEAASCYFSAFAALIRNEDPFFAFTGRNRRPPRDAVNAVLSLLYVLLTQDCRTAAEATGLDPQMGFLHRDRPGRMSLALDLAEEFRAPLADATCLALINRRQLSSRDFERQDTGAVLLNEEGRRTVISAWQKRKKTTLEHPFLRERAPLGLFPHLQAMLLARHLRGELDGYPAFVWR